VLALHGDDGALMVDAGSRNADALLRAVHAATGTIASIADQYALASEQTGANEAVGVPAARFSRTRRRANT